ncbi:MAG: class I SAM-dependent methyltransferase [Deltaproteobacteria bacterium]|nr:class I SAM-dependent methyltransferase [Deltaproteobacteria bacterium]
MLAREVALRESLAFVSRWLAPASRVLEVGCGAGDLAAALGAAGHRVVAIDAHPERVAEARARGVDARQAAFPDFSADAFDAVLFTHSLHHVHDLAGAVARARELLRPGGPLVIEDFTWDELDAGSAGWAYAYFAARRDELRAPERMWRHDGDVLATWRKHFIEHELHGASALRAALARHFATESSGAVPYFFRFACFSLGDAENGAELSESVLRDERAAITRGELAPLGWQLVLR